MFGLTMSYAMLHSLDLRDTLSWVIQDIHSQGWAQGTGGNFSAVISRTPLTLLMAPSGIDKGLVQPEDLIEVDGEGTVVQGKGRTSAETLLHLTVVKETGAGAVLHTHSVFNTLLSEYYADRGKIMLSGYEMLKGLEGIQNHEETVTIPVVPNSQDMKILSQSVRPFLSDTARSYGFLVVGHGLYTWGDTLFHARRHLEILEFLFELTYRKLTLR